MSFLRDISCEHIMDSLADGVFTVDPDWNITFFNRAASAITKVPRAEALGRKCWEVFRSSICDGSCALKAALKAGESRSNRSLFFVRPDGEKVPISISAAPLRDRRGKIVGGVETFRDLSALRLMQQKLDSMYRVEDILSRSPAFQRTLGILPQIAASGSTVLVLGESGTGKELVARAIHNLSARAAKPFVAVNCGALPENLLEGTMVVLKGSVLPSGAAAVKFDRTFHVTKAGYLYAPTREGRNEAMPLGREVSFRAEVLTGDMRAVAFAGTAQIVECRWNEVWRLPGGRIVSGDEARGLGLRW